MKRIDENHSFNHNVCCVLGGHCQKAILLKEIYGWCVMNNARNHNIKFGIVWTFMSANGFSKKFEYMKEGSIDRWLRELEKDGWLHSRKLNSKGYDRTKWYTINYSRYDSAVTGKEIPIPQIEEWKTQIEECITQIEGPIPSTTTSTTQYTIKEEKFDENYVMDENNVTLCPEPQTLPYGMCIPKAQHDMETYFSFKENVDSTISETGYDISLPVFNEQKRTFITRMSAYGQKKARTFPQLRGYFVTWLRNGYETHRKKELREGVDVQKLYTPATINDAVATYISKVAKSSKKALKLKDAENILENMKGLIGALKVHKIALAKYKPLTAEQLVALEYAYPKKTDKKELSKALALILKYRTPSETLYNALRIQLEA